MFMRWLTVILHKCCLNSTAKQEWKWPCKLAEHWNGSRQWRRIDRISYCCFLLAAMTSLLKFHSLLCCSNTDKETERVCIIFIWSWLTFFVCLFMSRNSIIYQYNRLQRLSHAGIPLSKQGFCLLEGCCLPALCARRNHAQPSLCPWHQGISKLAFAVQSNAWLGIKLFKGGG